MLAPQGTQALEAPKVRAPEETKARPDCPRAGTLPQAASRKEVSTAQWEGVGKHSHNPHCFQLWGQPRQAQYREFPHTGTVVIRCHLTWQNSGPGAVSMRVSGRSQGFMTGILLGKCPKNYKARLHRVILLQTGQV